MNQEEAKNAIKAGFKVRHHYFLPHEYIQLSSDGFNIMDEDKVHMQPFFWKVRDSPAWLEGWEIVDEKNIPKPKHRIPQ